MVTFFLFFSPCFKTYCWTENPQFPHVGEVVDGVDMRAEVGVLTRNILIKGETENTCYREKECQFFSYDTFGGHIKVWKTSKINFLSYKGILSTKRSMLNFKGFENLQNINSFNCFVWKWLCSQLSPNLTPQDLVCRRKGNNAQTVLEMPSRSCKVVWQGLNCASDIHACASYNIAE